MWFGLNPQGMRSLRTSISCTTLAIAAVTIRLICKRKTGNGFQFDDWWILFALVTGTAANAVAIWGSITGGGGKEMEEILTSGSPDVLRQLANYLEGLELAWTFYLASAFAIKISLLCLYRRIFATPGYQKICLVIMVVSTLWFIGAEIGNFIICIPFDAFWNRFKPGRCLDFNVYALCIGIIEIIIDSSIIILPLKVVLGLHLPTQRKVALTGIFMLGGFVMISGIVRVKFMYQPLSIYVRFANSLIWSNVHIMTAIVCACLPVYKPLWQWAASFVNRVVSYYNSKNGRNSYLPSFVRRSAKGTGEKPPQIPTLAPASAFNNGMSVDTESMTGTIGASEHSTVQKSASVRENSRSDCIV